MKEAYTVADLNPRAAASKQLEMTVRRALQLVEAFDALDKGEDWQAVPAPVYRRIFGHVSKYKNGEVPKHGDKWFDNKSMIIECWNRYKTGRFFSEIMDLYANLPPATRQKKEIAKGIKSIEGRIADGQPGRRNRTHRGG